MVFGSAIYYIISQGKKIKIAPIIQLSNANSNQQLHPNLFECLRGAQEVSLENLCHVFLKSSPIRIWKVSSFRWLKTCPNIELVKKQKKTQASFWKQILRRNLEPLFRNDDGIRLLADRGNRAVRRKGLFVSNQKLSQSKNQSSKIDDVLMSIKTTT